MHFMTRRSLRSACYVIFLCFEKASFIAHKDRQDSEMRRYTGPTLVTAPVQKVLECAQRKTCTVQVKITVVGLILRKLR